MKINIDQLIERELVDLNRRIVERLRMLHQMHAHLRIMEFNIGERVSFQTDRHEMVTGTLVRYNKKSVTVASDDGGRWTVSPGLLRKAGSPAAAHRTGKVIDADVLGAPFRRNG